MGNNQNYLEQLEEINKYYQYIRNTESNIANLLDEFYKNTIEPLRSDINIYNNQIIKLKNSTITANVGNIINQYATLLGVKPSDIDISYFTSYNIRTSSRYFAKNNVERFNATKNHSNDTIDILIKLVCKEMDIEDEIKSKIFLNSIQADGKTLGEHILAKQTSKRDNTYIVNVDIDNPRALNFHFTLNDLITQTQNGAKVKDIISKAILDSANQKTQQETIENEGKL